MPDPQFPDPATGRSESTRPFECSCTDGALDAAWVHVAGALDIATTPQLAQTLRESDARLVVLDLRELEFMDCSGVHAIVNARRRAQQLGRRLLVLRGPAHVERILSLTGHSHEIQIGDLGSVGSPGSLQRSLVASSLLKTNGNGGGRGRSH